MAKNACQEKKFSHKSIWMTKNEYSEYQFLSIESSPSRVN